MSAIHTALPPEPVMIATRLPLRQLAEGKGGRDIDHVVEVLAADDAVMPEDRVVDRARPGQRAGMRRGGAPAGVGAADLGDDHRLAGPRRLVGDRAEAGRLRGCLRDSP